MDAIRKKMQSLKNETDGLFATIKKHEDVVTDANAANDKFECDIRDLGKKIQTYECDFDETNDKLTKVQATFEEKEKEFKNAEEDVGALTSRVRLMDEGARRADTALADTVTKLAIQSKEADAILKKVKYFENKTMRNEVELEEGDKNLRETTKMASDNEQKLDELSRKLGVQEDECKRATERAELAEGKLKDVEQELETVGENMKQLEISAEKASCFIFSPTVSNSCSTSLSLPSANSALSVALLHSSS
jgi:chromosome segregation ATPase